MPGFVRGDMEISLRGSMQNLCCQGLVSLEGQRLVMGCWGSQVENRELKVCASGVVRGRR